MKLNKLYKLKLFLIITGLLITYLMVSYKAFTYLFLINKNRGMEVKVKEYQNIIKKNKEENQQLITELKLLNEDKKDYYEEYKKWIERNEEIVNYINQ